MLERTEAIRCMLEGNFLDAGHPDDNESTPQTGGSGFLAHRVESICCTPEYLLTGAVGPHHAVQTEYGIFKEAFFVCCNGLRNVATFGMGMSAFYFIPRQPERGGQIALNILLYNFLIVGWIPLVVVVAYPQILRIAIPHARPRAFSLCCWGYWYW